MKDEGGFWMPPPEGFDNLLSLVTDAWRAFFGAPATAAAAALTRRFSLPRLIPRGTPVSAKSGETGLQIKQSGLYAPPPMVAAEIKWDTLGGRLIEARTIRGLTRPQLSRAVGYAGQSTLWRYETGQVLEAREDVVLRFANALGCDPLWLMYGRGEPNWRDPA